MKTTGRSTEFLPPLENGHLLCQDEPARPRVHHHDRALHRTMLEQVGRRGPAVQHPQDAATRQGVDVDPAATQDPLPTQARAVVTDALQMGRTPIVAGVVALEGAVDDQVEPGRNRSRANVARHAKMVRQTNDTQCQIIYSPILRLTEKSSPPAP